jgi:hypothetical protein
MDRPRHGTQPVAEPRSLVSVTALGLAAFLVGCATPVSVDISAESDDLTLTAKVTAAGGSIVVESLLRNGRDGAVHVVPDQCGRVMDVELERTVFEPEGATWDGSLQVVKALILDDQRSRQGPDSFHPRRVGEASADVPECVRPDRVTRLEPGAQVTERWELPTDPLYASALAELGSDGTRISLEAVEARDPERLEYLDFLQARDEPEERAGRVIRAELATSLILEREPSRPLVGPSMGELYDRLVADRRLRAWIEAQPPGGWQLASLQPAIAGAGDEWAVVRLRLVTTAYERAARVVARPDGSAPEVRLPDERFRTKELERRSGTLPPGIDLIAEPDSYVLADDLLLGDVRLPSGRVVVGEYLMDLEPLDFTVGAGRYPVHATLARHPSHGDEDVSFATLVLSEAPTERWENVGAIAVDGGTATIVSVEGRDHMSDLFTADERGWWAENDDMFDSLASHGYLATRYELAPGLDLTYLTSGVGDGGYPVYVGFDAGGRPTRVVVDFYLLHLAWPASPDGPVP